MYAADRLPAPVPCDLKRVAETPFNHDDKAWITLKSVNHASSSRKRAASRSLPAVVSMSCPAIESGGDAKLFGLPVQCPKMGLEIGFMF